MDFEKMNCGICGSKENGPLFSKQDGEMTFSVVRCRNCGFQFMNPMITKKGLEKVYSSDYYKDYNLHEQHESDSAMYGYINTVTARRIIEMIKKKNGRMLDIGCAMGFFLDSMRKEAPGWKFSGCDISAESVRSGKKKLRLDLSAGEVEQCRYKKEEFDLVTLRETIEHLREPAKTMKEVNRITKNGGYVVIQTGNMDSLMSRISGKKHFYYNIAHVSYFSPKTMRLLLKKSGFTVKKIEGIRHPEEYIFRNSAKSLAKLLAIKTLDRIRFRNFSVLGGMFVLAQKTGDAE
jgi:ubiquinone/menaquinone biosynthesis C-methylase UbiE